MNAKIAFEAGKFHWKKDAPCSITGFFLLAVVGRCNGALMGKRLDDEVFIQRPKGDTWVTIVD
ncbi:MAG: hypothetical protein JXR76_12390, partial [Deltaproteobacteria bacterium]|nr:hypothetical protein [Deltaproteobacteria bacterium]